MASSIDPKIIGIVLAGGKSSRMQQAKAHLSVHGMPQWQYCEKVLSAVCDGVYFSVSKQLLRPLLVSKDRLIDDVFTEPIGPLGGIISAFRKFPDSALFVLACDLFFFSEEAARTLAKARNPLKQATVFMSDGLIEPLCAIFEPSIKDELMRAWIKASLCPRKILSSLNVNIVTVPEQQWLTNVNHAHEWQKLSPTKSFHSIKVHYYASLRVSAGLSSETINTDKKTVGELYAELAKRYGFSLEANLMRFAKNDELVPEDAALFEHDSIVFIPPVSGG